MARIAQVGQQRAIAAAQVEHARARLDPPCDQVEVVAQGRRMREGGHAPTSRAMLSKLAATTL